MFTRRDFLQAAAATSLCSLLPGKLRAEAVAEGGGGGEGRRLNVLFMMVDDLRPELNCYGVPEVHSPNIDRLTAKGVRFDRAYCQFPVCNPSRSSMLTGLRPETLGIFTNARPDTIRLKRPDVVTIPQLFRQHGYYTASFGKVLHNGINAQGKLVASDDPPSWELCKEDAFDEHTLQGERVDYSKKYIMKQADWCWWESVPNMQDHPDMWVAAKTIEQLEAHREGPFFIAAGFHKPHDPYVAPSSCFDLYPAGKVKLPQEPADRSPIEKWATSKSDFFRNFTPEDRIALKRAYHACTTFTDAQIGRVLDAMDRLNLWDNTIVVLLVDHGYHLWEHDWLGKATTYDLSARVPCIVWAPGMAGMGRATKGIIESLDMFPTLAELCGLAPPPVIEGKSFVPLLRDPSGPGKDAAYTIIRGLPNSTGYTPMDGRGVRTDRWRYVEWSNGDVALFDHSKDPLEYYNIAAKPENEATCAQMKEVLHRIQKG
jgi:arylsulfatase A-like enzyme